MYVEGGSMSVKSYTNRLTLFALDPLDLRLVSDVAETLNYLIVSYYDVG